MGLFYHVILESTRESQKAKVKNQKIENFLLLLCTFNI